MLFVNLGLKEQTLLAAAVYDEAMKEMHQVNGSATLAMGWGGLRGVCAVWMVYVLTLDVVWVEPFLSSAFGRMC